MTIWSYCEENPSNVGYSLQNIARQAMGVARPSEFQIKIDSIRLEGAPDVGFLQHFYVDVELDQRTCPDVSLVHHDTGWNLERKNEICIISNFTLRLYLRRKMHHPELVGSISESVQSLLSTSGGVSRQIFWPSDSLMHDWHGKAMIIHVEIKRLLLGGGTQVVDELGILANQPKVHDPGAKMIKTMISNASPMFEFHPGAKMAFALLSTTYNIFLVDPDHSKSLQELVETMSATYSFASEAKSSLDNNRQAFRLLARYTTECSYFVREYVTKRGILHNFINWSTTVNVEMEIKGYTKKFQELEQFFRRCCKATPQKQKEKKSYSANVNYTELNAMHRSDSEYNDEHHSGTLKTIDDIMAWASDQGHARVCLLTGDQDSSMSDIAWHIACMFKALCGPCSMYSFRQNDLHLGDQPVLQHPRNLFQIIADDLAGKHQSFQQSLASSDTIIGTVDSLPGSGCDVVSAQFQELILAPAKRMEDTKPVFIIIDALDECGLDHARKSISTTLVEKAGELPVNCRILITGHPEKDVAGMLRDGRHVVERSIGVQS
ncbi:hypothetical protein BS17DRAFT_562152 [Gyrodon lividus]|nr:hypothetical protein BS17DRAFT_562152 [Gyrodon lividus]